MSVLYRKYRPQRFSDVIGQKHIKVTLANEIASGALAHAYLFIGPRGTGKTTMARLFARSINCLNRKEGEYEPCNTCTSCSSILNEKSLDIIEIDAATHTQVDNVRDHIITNVHVPPIAKNGFKVFIIDEVHMLSKHAFNALLKTIEEPPTHVIFILATTDVYKVPDTIISRCQRFDFKKIQGQLIVQRLRDICIHEKITISDAILAGIARKSDGCMRDAESLLGQVVTIAEKGVVDDATADLIIPRSNWLYTDQLLEYLQQRNLSAALVYIQERIDEGMESELFMHDLIEYIRFVLLKKSIGPSYSPDVDQKTSERIAYHANVLEITELKRLLEIVVRESAHLGNSSIQQLPLELACIEFCQDTLQPSIQSPLTPRIEKLSGQLLTTAIDNPDMEQLKKNWIVIVDGLKTYNHSLSIFLKVAHPITITKDTIVLGFRFDFHANTVNDTKNKKKAEDAISSILGRRITIDCIVDPQYTDNHKIFHGANEPEVQDVLEVMGGGELV